MFRFNISRLSLLILIMILSGSCKKYLDEKAIKSQVVLQTVDDLQAMMDDNATMNNNTPGFGETCADDYYVTDANYALILSIGEGYALPYKWQSPPYYFQNDWALNYAPVYPSNYVLEMIEKIPATAQNTVQWNNVKGSALYYRAFRFLDLIWEYGKAFDSVNSATDPGIALRMGSDFNAPSLRASVKQSYEQVLSDAKLAAVYLPNLPQHIMRPSKAAAYALVARAYLSMRQYDSAYRYSDLSLQIKSDLLDYNSSSITPTGNAPFTLTNNPELLFFGTESGNYPSKTTSFALIDTVLYASYEASDIRKTAFFKAAGGQQFKGSYSGNSNLYSGIATDELFLTRAECEARLNRPADAFADLNALLSKRYKTGTYVVLSASNTPNLLNKILLERRKELLMRGLRWIDIKRLNKENAGITPKRLIAGQSFTLPPNDDRYALPLPADVISISGMAQNPGW